jgi:hypothetical protein
VSFVSFSTCTEIHTYVQLRFANLCLFRFRVLLCLMSLFFEDFCFVCDELLIQIQEFIIHHHVDEKETKTAEMKNRVFRAHLCFC